MVVDAGWQRWGCNWGGWDRRRIGKKKKENGRMKEEGIKKR